MNNRSHYPSHTHGLFYRSFFFFFFSLSSAYRRAHAFREDGSAYIICVHACHPGVAVDPLLVKTEHLFNNTDYFNNGQNGLGRGAWVLDFSRSQWSRVIYKYKRACIERERERERERKRESERERGGPRDT